MLGKSFSVKTARGVGIAFSLFIVAYILITLIGGMIIGLLGVKNGSLSYYALSSLFPTLTLLFLVVISCKFSKASVKETVKVKKSSPIYILLAIVIAIGMFLGFGFLNSAFASFLQKLGGVIPTTGVTDAINSTGSFILFSFLICLFPAITEELFFRGVMLTGLKNTGRVFTTIMVAVSFALYHASLAQLIYQLIYGAVLSILTIKSNSVIPSMIAHFINNLLVLVLTYFFNFTSAITNPLLIALGIVLVVSSVVFICLYKKKQTEKVEIIKGEKKEFLIFSLVGIITSIVIAIMGVIPV